MATLNVLVSAAMLALLPSAASAADRIELPIRAVTLSDGTHRFGVPLSIDGRPVEAGLDTGSTGLRVMARAMPGSPADGPRTHYHFNVGTELNGTVVSAPVAFGTVSGRVKVQRVDGLSCIAGLPKCPVSHNADQATFGIQADGLPDEGFAAILGIDFRTDAVPNPLRALGVHQWIIDLPRPGDTRPGRMILNPTAADTAGYINYPLMPDHQSIEGCIAGPKPLGKICGWARLDTGAPGLFVFDIIRRDALQTAIPVTMSFGGGKSELATDLVTGRRDEASRLILGQVVDAQQPRLLFGVAPYFRWSVLYDADAQTIGLRPR